MWQYKQRVIKDRRMVTSTFYRPALCEDDTKSDTKKMSGKVLE